jgi:threonine dehydrogenase-like Zn-dependent dehydrogenase
VGADTINYEEMDTLQTLKEWTGGRGPDACIDAVGMEAHMHGVQFSEMERNNRWPLKSFSVRNVTGARMTSFFNWSFHTENLSLFTSSGLTPMNSYFLSGLYTFVIR